MDIEESKEELELFIRSIRSDIAEESPDNQRLADAIQTLLNELDKKDAKIKLLNDQKQYMIKIINEMAEKIYYLQDEKLLAGYSKQEVIDYFTKKAEGK